MTSDEDAFSLVVGQAARGVAQLKWQMRHIMVMAAHLHPVAVGGLSFEEMRIAVAELVIARGGRQDAIDAVHEAIEFANTSREDAQPVLDDVWIAVDGLPDSWAAMSMAPDVTGQAGARVMTLGRVREIVDALTVAHGRLIRVGFLIPDPSGEYFFDFALEDNIKGARGEG